MAFSGTLDKCKACDNKVYVVDLVTADGIPFHKTCFKCSHCNGRLVLGRYISIDGVLYCTPHFEQLLRQGKIQNHTPKKPMEQGKGKLASKLSAMFSGTQDKCSSCKKTGGCLLTPSNYAALDGILYCKTHFGQLFKEKGSYGYLSKSISTKKGVDPLSSDVNPSPEEVGPSDKY
ncbi:hypothetical protein V2J09_004762 [Rumex salicifolius]